MNEVTDHLSPAQLAAYSARQIPSAERLAVSDHLAACAACRSLVRGPEQFQAAPRVFADLVGAAREGSAAPTLDDAWQSDAALPPRTPEELAQLREFEATMMEFEPERFVPGGTLREEPASAGRRRSAPAESVGWWRWLTLPWAVGLAAAVVAATLLLARGTWSPTGRESGHAAELVDGTLTIRSDGELEGMLSLPAGLRDAVLETVRRRAAPGALLGTVTRGDVSTPVPVKTEDSASPEGVIETDRPTFRWSAGAVTGAEISVQPSAGGDPVLSGPLPPGSREWTPPQGMFMRGRLYRWQLRTGDTPGRSIAFKVLGADAHARLEALRGGPAGGSHLALGVAYAREGLHAAAREEFQRLESANAGSTLARQLSASAGTWQ